MFIRNKTLRLEKKIQFLLYYLSDILIRSERQTIIINNKHEIVSLLIRWMHIFQIEK